MATNTIKINPKIQNTIDFDVSISGSEELKITPIVKFVLYKVKDDMDISIYCSNTALDRWKVTIPKLSWITVDKCSYGIEIILDEYYFNPVKGEIVLIKVKAEQTKTKPTVNATISIKNTEDISEAMGGPDISGQWTPPNEPLKPEFDPNFKQGKIKNHMAQNDPQIDLDKLSNIGKISPGTGGESYPEDTKNSSKRSLFSRDKDGKVLVPGLNTIEKQQQQVKREQAVRDILKDLK